MIVTSLCLAISARNVPPPERRVLLPLDYKGVQITGGMLRKQLDDAVQDYLRIPNDDLLIGFRKRAGLPAPGKELGGWYSDDVFSVFGQILSGLARMYAATGDPACKAKADALLDGWSKCIGPDGYFYYSRRPNAPHYIYDKIVGGLVDMAVYGGRPDALSSLAKITRWAEKNLDRSNKYAFGETEWYTLSENLYRAYLATNDTRYANFAKVWEYTPYWKQYATGQSIFSKRPDGGQTVRYHAYSHVNNLGGAALAYRVTGNSWYLDTIKNAYDFLQKDECFATGGFGPDEALVPHGQLEKMLESTTASFETQCGTWAVFKLCKNLIALTGDAKYGDWVEQVAYNGIAATIPMTPDGQVFYYSSYNPFGAQKVNNGTRWTCCTGTRPMAIADVCDVAYFQAPDGLDVNLFVPSMVRFQRDGAQIALTQETRFPESPTTKFTITASRPTTFALRVRNAAWFTGPPTVTLNGEPTHFVEDGKHWLTLKRKWSSGDHLTLELPMGFRSIPLTPGTQSPTAIAMGPVVLAFRNDLSPVGKVDLKNLADNFIPSPGEALTYHLRSDENILARPFYAYKEGEPYYMYLDAAARGRVTYQRFKRSGAWSDSGNILFSNVPGNWLEATFEGTSVKLLGYLFDDGGHASVEIDGKAVRTIEQYGPGRDIPHDQSFSGLSPGRHTIRITILPDKSDASKDRYINVAGLQVLGVE